MSLSFVNSAPGTLLLPFSDAFTITNSRPVAFRHSPQPNPRSETRRLSDGQELSPKSKPANSAGHL